MWNEAVVQALLRNWQTPGREVTADASQEAGWFRIAVRLPDDESSTRYFEFREPQHCSGFCQLYLVRTRQVLVAESGNEFAATQRLADARKAHVA